MRARLAWHGTALYCTPRTRTIRIAHAHFSDSGVLTQCLKNPTGAPTIVKSRKKEILKSDLDALVSAATSHHSAKYVASVANTTSWCRLWDLALDRGVQGTRGLQTLLKVISLRIYKNSLCPSCDHSLPAHSLWFDHLCSEHPDVVNHLTCSDILSCLKEADADKIFAIANSRLNSILPCT